MNVIATGIYRTHLGLEVPVGRFGLWLSRERPRAESISAEADDERLISESLGGDERAFRILVERYQGHIVRTVTGMLGPSADIDDVVQEVFIRFHRALPRFRSESSVKTYLTRIAINRSLDVLRTRRRRWLVPLNVVETDPIRSDSPEPDEVAERSDRRRKLRRAVDTLPPRQRAVVVLRLIDGLSTAETAEALKVPYGTVLSRLNRALAKLRETLGVALDDRVAQEKTHSPVPPEADGTEPKSS